MSTVDADSPSARKTRKRPEYERRLAEQCVEKGLPAPLVDSFKFHPERKWRADLAWPERKLLVEIEGGHFSGGRHTRGAGFRADCEKYAEAACLGYTVLRVPGEWVTRADRPALVYILRLFGWTFEEVETA